MTAAAAAVTDKAFATLRATAALQGYRIVRSNPADGAVVYFIERFGLVRVLTPGELRGLLEPAEARP